MEKRPIQLFSSSAPIFIFRCEIRPLTESKLDWRCATPQGDFYRSLISLSSGIIARKPFDLSRVLVGPLAQLFCFSFRPCPLCCSFSQRMSQHPVAPFGSFRRHQRRGRPQTGMQSGLHPVRLAHDLLRRQIRLERNSSHLPRFFFLYILCLIYFFFDLK